MTTPLPPNQPVGHWIDEIAGKRFSIADIRHLLGKKLPIGPDGAITAEIATALQKLLDGKKTGVLTMIDSTTGKLYLSQETSGQISLHQVEMMIDMTSIDSFMGHSFDQKDKTNLEKYGNMGRKVTIAAPAEPENNESPGEIYEGYIGVNKDTRSLKLLRVDEIKIYSKLKGVALSQQQRAILIEGKALRLDNMKGTKGRFSAYVRIHAGLGKITFDKIPGYARRKASTGHQLPSQQDNPPIALNSLRAPVN